MIGYFFGILTVLVNAIITVIGWLIGWSFALIALNDGTLMQLNTAGCIILVALALTVVKFKGWGALISGPAVVLCFLTLFEYSSGLNLHIDTMLVPFHMVHGIVPGRMGMNTALSIVLLSVPLYYSRGHIIARSCIISALVLATVGLIGHMLGYDKLYTWGAPIGIGMANTTAGSLLILGAIEFRDRFKVKEHQWPLHG